MLLRRKIFICGAGDLLFLVYAGNEQQIPRAKHPREG